VKAIHQAPSIRRNAMITLSISKFRAGLFAAVLAVAPLSPALHGQDVGMIVNVNVPFAFQTASGHHFNPGIYSIKMENVHTLLIRGDSDVALTPATAEDNAQPAKTGRATFRRYGNEYFLTEITVQGSSRSLHFAKSREEKRVQIAAGEIAPTNVEVALLGTAH
jgi:hypothetical protein